MYYLSDYSERQHKCMKFSSNSTQIKGVLHLNISLFRQIFFLCHNRSDKPLFEDICIFIEILQFIPETFIMVCKMSILSGVCLNPIISKVVPYRSTPPMQSLKTVLDSPCRLSRGALGKYYGRVLDLC